MSSVMWAGAASEAEACICLSQFGHGAWYLGGGADTDHYSYCIFRLSA